MEKLSPIASTLYFWAAIIIIRTAATNVGDAFHDVGIGFGISLPLVLVGFAAAVLLYRSSRKTDASHDGSVQVNLLYWVCMIMAGILGTIGGDFAAFGVGFMPPGAAAVFAVIVAAALYRGRGGQVLQPTYYWTTLALIRTFGTAAGDTLAHALTLPASTAITGLIFLGMVGYFYGIEKCNQAMAPVAS